MSTWLSRVMSGESESEREFVDRYSRRLLEFARSQLPSRVQARVDPEDVVQSVYRSFFQRLKEGRFVLEDSIDVWRLLAAMTYQKVWRTTRFHEQQRRHVNREQQLGTSDRDGITDEVFASSEPGPHDVAVLFEYLELLLDRVPASYRDIVVLRLNGESVDEIAKKVRRTKRTVFRAFADMEKLAQGLMERSV